MEKKKGFSYLLLFIGFGVVSLVSVVLIIVVVGTTERESLAAVFGEGTLIRSETVCLVILLALLLPAAIFGLMWFLLKEKFNFQLYREKEEKEEDDVRFHALTAIDRQAAARSPVAYMPAKDLRGICEDFRNYAAAYRHLYYSPEDIRCFIAGLGVSHLMVMQGLSGSGKTSLATVVGEYFGHPAAVVSVQPMWKERSDVIGYFNEFTKKYNESVLLKELYAARYTDDIHVVVLDEMNIARVEYYFADFLSLMELDARNRYLEMTSDVWPKDPLLFENGRFRLPENVWFIGTANNDDSTFAVSDKVYDRAMIMNLERKAQPFTPVPTWGTRISCTQFRQMVANAIAAYEISDDVRDKIAELDSFLIEHYRITYGNRIRRQMEEYVAIYIACGGMQMKAVDDFLAKKVLRKLEGQNPLLLEKAGKAISSKLDELFGEDAMPQCRDYLRYLQQLAG